METENIDPALCTDYATQGDESDEDWDDLYAAHGGEQNFGKTAKLIVMEKVHENGPEKDWREYFKPYDYDETAYDSRQEYPDDESREKFIHEATLKQKIFDAGALRPIEDTLREFERDLDDNIFQVVDYRYFNYIEELNENDYTRYRFPFHRFSNASLRVYSTGTPTPLGCFIVFGTLTMFFLMLVFWNKYVFIIGGLFFLAFVLMRFLMRFCGDYFHIDSKTFPKFNYPFDRKSGCVDCFFL